MRVAMFLLRGLMSAVYFFLKCFPTRSNKLVFLSRQSNAPSDEVRFLFNQLMAEKPDVQIVAITRRVGSGLRGILEFGAVTLRSMYHLATSSVCLLDAYWPAVSMLKHKPTLTVIQMWHAMGKIKKSGYQSLGKQYGRGRSIAKGMRMHRGYDVVIAGAEAFNPSYCAAFGIEESKLYNVGLPRMDMLRENGEANRRRFFRNYPELKGKHIVLYAPTFRKGQLLDPTELVKAFHFDENRALVIKKHPNQLLAEKDYGEAVICHDLPPAVVLSACDCVITDYGAITIEAAVIKKPVYFYMYDYEEYISRNGLNLDPHDEFPDSVFDNAQELVRAIEDGGYDFDHYERFRKKYLPDPAKGRATDKITRLIVNCMEKGKDEALKERAAVQA